MNNSDFMISPIEYALQETIKKFENSDKDDEKLIYELLKRSEAIWSSIKINGLQTYGMTYEDFCNQCKEKRNVLFLTDEELENINKAIQVVNIMK